MKKNDNKILSFQNFSIIILFIIIFFSTNLFNKVSPNDELWVFQNMCKIYNGFTIYKDANVITTPLFFYIGAIILKLLGPKMLFIRLYNILIYSTIIILIYKILRNLNVTKHIAVTGVILIFLQNISIINAGANYNALSLLFALIGINLYIKKNYNFIIHGLLVFLVFFTKQNIGCYYFIAILCCDLFIYKLSKDFFINVFKKICIFLFCLASFLLYYHFNNTLMDFLNYTVGSIMEFGQENFIISVSFSLLIIFIIPFPIYLYLLYYRKKSKKVFFNNNQFYNLTILLFFTLFISLYVYPIINNAHVLFALNLHLIFLFYLLDIVILEDFFKDDSYRTNFNWFSILVLFFIIFAIILDYISSNQTCSLITDKTSHYYGFMIKDDYINKTNSLKNYILEKNKQGIDVIIYSYDSAFPMVELKQSHGAYDLLFNGNLGYNGKEKIKNDVLTRKNTEYLIVTNEEDLCEQEPKEIRTFIMDNLNYEGTIENYSIYSTKK